MQQIPHHGGMHQGFVPGTYPAGLLPAVDMHIANRVAIAERSVQDQVAREFQARDTVLSDQLDRVHEELQEGRARSLELTDGLNERMRLSYKCLKEDILELGRRLDMVEEVVETTRVQEETPSTPWHALEAKLESIMSTQRKLQAQINKLEAAQTGSVHHTRREAEASPLNLRTIHHTSSHFTSGYCHTGLSASTSALATSSGCGIESSGSAEVSVGTTCMENGIGTSPPSSPDMIAERSFAVQATSPQAVSHFRVQTEDVSWEAEQLRPAQWHDELDSPLSSRESSPGGTVQELRLLMRRPATPHISTSHERDLSSDGAATGSESPSTYLAMRSQSVGVGMSPSSPAHDQLSRPVSSDMQTQSAGSPSLSPLRSSPTLFGSDWEAPQRIVKPSSGILEAIIDRSLSPLPACTQQKSSNAQVLSNGETSSSQSPPTPDPSMESTSVPSPTPSLSSILDVSSGTTSTMSSNPASRSSSLPPIRVSIRDDAVRRSASVHSTPRESSTEHQDYPTAINVDPVTTSSDPVDLFSPAEESPPPAASSPSIESVSPVRVDKPQGTVSSLDAICDDPISIDTPGNSNSTPFEWHNPYLALSGLDLARSPSILTDIDSEEALPENSRRPGRQGSLTLESITGVCRRKRTTSVGVRHRSGPRKRRKTDSVRGAHEPSGSQPPAHSNGKPRRGRLPKSPQMPENEFTNIFQSQSNWQVVKGYPGPYTWPRKKGKNVDDLATIQCDKCDAWYHYDCVGVTAFDKCVQEEDAEYICPPCVTSMKVMNEYRELQNVPQQTGMCGRPDCNVRSFSPERFVGRLSHTLHDSTTQIMYLVKWLSWPDTEATWEPLHILQKDLDADMINSFVRNFEHTASREGLVLGRKKTMVALPGFRDIARTRLPPSVRHGKN